MIEEELGFGVKKKIKVIVSHPAHSKIFFSVSYFGFIVSYHIHESPGDLDSSTL